tara:strand:+ start:212 stop:553 length:342 start_codon:yes stop_codon:yes gene_type:complete
MAKATSDRRRQRRHYLKMMKKAIGTIINGELFTTSDYKNMCKGFREDGKALRIEGLREILEKEKEVLAHQEGELRIKYKADGLKPKSIDKLIESWYDKQKIWALHNDVINELT